MKTESRSIVLLAVLLLPLLVGLQLPAEVAASGIPDPRFGVVEAHDAPNAATALGAGWTRVSFRWNEIQPNGPGEWNIVSISDELLANELAHGREVVGLLVTVPGWATDLDAGPGVPRGLYLPTEDPGNLWAGFVRTIVGRYAGRIDRWIVWNEPDIPDTRHMSWGGSHADFVRLLQVAYTVARETNPEAVIHMAAVTHWWNESWFGQFLEALTADPAAAANNYYFDVATLHIYFQPETVYDITVHYRDMMRGHGINKPMWIAETNAAPSRDPGWPVPNAQFDVSLEQQAAYIVQAFSLGIAAGAERMAVYKMADTDTDREANPEPFGLVRLDGSRRPAFRAYQAAANHLAGFRGAAWERRDAISLVTVDRGDRTTSVVWARTAEAQTAVVPARATQALLVDVRGGARVVYPEGGYYTVQLPGANCSRGCQIGGAPAMLVEGAPAAAHAAPTPGSPTSVLTLPAVQSPEAGTSYEPDEAPPQTATSRPSPTASPTARLRVKLMGTALAPAGRTPTPSPTGAATATATATSTLPPSLTPSPSGTSSPTSSPVPTPSPAPEPIGPQAGAGGHSWIMIGVLLFGLAGLAQAAGRGQT